MSAAEDIVKAVIIDDEENNVANLQSLLRAECPAVVVSGTANSASEGKKLILAGRPEIVFLDIQMPGEDGFDLLRSLGQRDFQLVFVTAHDQYAIQAIRFAAIDYLLKPINVNELRSAVDRACEAMRRSRQNPNLENLIDLLKHRQQPAEHRIALPGAKETRFVNPAVIIRCEALNNYTNFFLENMEKIIVSQPIYIYEELLQPYGFLRCHQSHLVNKKFIRSWVREDGGYLLLEDGQQVPVSRAKKEQLRNWLQRS